MEAIKVGSLEPPIPTTSTPLKPTIYDTPTRPKASKQKSIKKSAKGVLKKTRKRVTLSKVSTTTLEKIKPIVRKACQQFIEARTPRNQTTYLALASTMAEDNGWSECTRQAGFLLLCPENVWDLIARFIKCDIALGNGCTYLLVRASQHATFRQWFEGQLMEDHDTEEWKEAVKDFYYRLGGNEEICEDDE